MSPSWPVEVVPLNPVSCASALWRMDGFLRVTIVVKATFGLVPDGPARLIAPEEIVARDRHHDRNPANSVEAAGELAPYVPKAGVVLVGHAYGPSGQAVPAVSARLSIFRERALLDKTVHVFGDRDAASPGSPRPFQRMPLRYERAFGGPDLDVNPVGTGVVAGSALPNLVDPSDPRRCAGFGPIATSWPARRSLLDPAARARVTEKIPELGAGFAFGYFQPAPPDQQLDAIEGDEWIILDGLHPALPRVRSRLPSVRGEARVQSGQGPLQPVELSADLLVIDTDRQVCSVIWRGHVVVAEGESALPWLRVYAGVEMPGRPLAWPAVSSIVEIAAAPSAPAIDAELELEADDELEPDPEDSPLGVTAKLSLADLQAHARKAVTPFAPVERPADEPPRAAPVGGTPWSVAAAPVLFFEGIADDGTHVPEAPAPVAMPALIATPAPIEARSSFEDDPDPADSTAMLSLADLEAHARKAIAPFAIAAAAPASAPRAATLTATPWGPSAPPIVEPAGPADETTRADVDATGSTPIAAPPAREPPTRGDKIAIPIVNPTPLIAVTVPWQIRPPKDSITIAVKGTFDLVADGAATLRAEGEFPIGDIHLDDDPGKSLAHGSDLAIFKTKADVTLVGTAYAPPSAGGSTPAMQVEFRFGAGARGFVRRAAVLGDRRWQKALLAIAPTAPEEFTTMPLTWERAFGGPAFEQNPVGAGHKGQAGDDGVSRLPNLEDPAHLVRSPGDAVAPVCFAPVAMLWKPRWSKLGTYDRRWFKQRWPYFPEDFDWGFFQIAPGAQQLAYLVGDETFSVVGMRPDAPRLDGRLPGMRARCFLQMTTEAGGDFRELPLVLDTAAFDLDALKLSLVWRAFVEVSDEEAPEIEAIFIAREDLDATPMSVAEAREQYLRAITPAPPEETEPTAEAVTIAPPPAAEPSGKSEIAEARAEVLAQLAAAGVPLPDDDAPPAPPPAPEPAAIAESLRAAGASEADIAEVLEAIRPPPEDADDEAADAPSPEQVRAKVIEMLAAGEPFDGLDLAGANLADLDFSGCSLVETLLKGAILARSAFAGAKLAGAILARADLTEASFVEADLTMTDLTATKAQRANFTGANVGEADFSSADLEGAILDAIHGESTHFERCRLVSAQLRGAKLTDADFTGANLDGAALDGASLPEARLYDVTAHGASFRDVVMPGARVEGAKATKAVFTNLDAPGSIWERAILNEATFLGAVLPGTSFARATCFKTVFSTADLTEARFRRAKLGGASFLRANLMMATFERADLTLADLRGANLHAAETWKAKLDHAQLDQAIVTGSKLA
jgi:uncharacterized protein YjbI with pentapeptide repeats